MLTEVRSLVAPQDLEMYDRLVLHREREAHQAWHGGLGVMHPQGLCNHAAHGSQDGGQGIPAAVGHLATITQNMTSIEMLSDIFLFSLNPFQCVTLYKDAYETDKPSQGQIHCWNFKHCQGYFVLTTTMLRLLVIWLLPKWSDNKFSLKLIYYKLNAIYKLWQLAVTKC